MRPTPACITAATVDDGFLRLTTTTGTLRVRLEAVVIRGDSLKIHRVERNTVTDARGRKRVVDGFGPGAAIGTYCHLSPADVAQLVALGVVAAEDQPRKAKVSGWRRGTFSVATAAGPANVAGWVNGWLGIETMREGEDEPLETAAQRRERLVRERRQRRGKPAPAATVTLTHIPSGRAAAVCGSLSAAKALGARMLAELPELGAWSGDGAPPAELRERYNAIFAAETPADDGATAPPVEQSAAPEVAPVAPEVAAPAPVAVTPDSGAPDLDALQTCAVTPDLRGLDVLDDFGRQHLAAWIDRHCGAAGEDDGRDAMRAEHLAEIAAALVEWPTAVEDGASWPQLADYGRLYLADAVSRLGGTWADVEGWTPPRPEPAPSGPSGDDGAPTPDLPSPAAVPPLQTCASAPDLRRGARRRPMVVATFDCGGVAVPAVRVARVRDAYGAVCRDCTHHVDEGGHLNLPWRWQQSKAMHERATGHRMDLYRLVWPERPPEVAAPVEATPPNRQTIARRDAPIVGCPLERRKRPFRASPLAAACAPSARGSWRHGPPAARRGTVSARRAVSVAAGHGSRPPPGLIGHSRLGRHRD